MSNIKADLNVINQYLMDYTEEVNEGIKQIAEELGKEGVAELKNASPNRKGKYAKSWRVKKDIGKTYVNITLHSFKYYNLTHLLEFGHATKNGKRTKAKPHIKPVEERINKEFEDRIKQLIGGVK